MDKFKLIQIFASVVKQGSFVEAAKILDASPSTVSKAIDRLESSLGVRLFQRTTRQLNLTSSGEAYYQKSISLLQEFDDFEARLIEGQSEPSGLLKVSVPVSFGRRRVEPLLSRFLKEYPQIGVEILLDDDHVDLIGEGYDVAIRTGLLKDNRFVAQQLSCMDMIVCATPKLAEQFSPLKCVADFEKSPWIYYRFNHTGKLLDLKVKLGRKIHAMHPEQRCVVNDGDVLLDLCKQGVGFAQLPHFIAQEALQRKTIVPVAPVTSTSGSGIYIVYPGRNYLPRRVRVFIDFMKRHLSRQDETPRGTWARKIPVYVSGQS